MESLVNRLRALVVAAAPLVVAAATVAQPCEPSWTPGFTGSEIGAVQDFAVFDDGHGGGPALYAAGNLSTLTVPFGGVARWTGSSWAPLQSPVSTFVQVIRVIDVGS